MLFQKIDGLCEPVWVNAMSKSGPRNTGGLKVSAHQFTRRLFHQLEGHHLIIGSMNQHDSRPVVQIIGKEIRSKQRP